MPPSSSVKPVSSLFSQALAQNLTAPGGKAAPASARPRHYTPCEFSLALEDGGLRRSSRWVSDECRAGRIATNPAFPGRHYIPESELFRLLGIVEAAG